jgi:hypothetical protein
MSQKGEAASQKTGQQRAEVRPEMSDSEVSHVSEAEVGQADQLASANDPSENIGKSNPSSPHVSIDSPSDRVSLESRWESLPATEDSAPPIVHPIVDWICPDGRRRWSVVRKNLSIGTGQPFKEGDYHLVVIWLSHVILAMQLQHSFDVFPSRRALFCCRRLFCRL